MAITIYGASDDLIEIKGDIVEEFDVLGKEVGTITLSDDTVIGYKCTNEADGIWRFEVHRHSTAAVHVRPCTGDEYSDRVEITGGVEWVRLDADGTVAR